MEELKRQVAGFPDYEISIWGNVYKNGQKIKPSVKGTNHGRYELYLFVRLINGSTKQKFYVHRLVADAFIPNPENKREVNHIDGNPQNNSITNLEWVTHKENIDHRCVIKETDYTDTLFPELTMQLPEKLNKKKWMEAT